MSSIEYINSVVLTDNATTTITFSSIPQNYTDLILTMSERSSQLRNSLFRFNGDTGTNYSTTRLAGNGSAASSARNSNETYIQGASVLSGMSSTNPTISILNILSYSNTNIFKTTLEEGGAAGTEVNSHVGLWRSTNAINSISLILNGAGNYISGDTFTLWGVR